MTRVIVKVTTGLMNRNLFPTVVGAKALVFMGPKGNTAIAESHDLVRARHVRLAINPQAGSLIGGCDLAEQRELDETVLGATIAKLGDLLLKRVEWLDTIGLTKSMSWSDGFHQVAASYPYLNEVSGLE